METAFNHPFAYHLAETKYFSSHDAVNMVKNIDQCLQLNTSSVTTRVKILKGNIHWSENAGSKDSLFVSKDVTYIAADDAIGQCAKILNKFGLTAFLEVSYEDRIPLNSTSKVTVTITKRGVSTRGSMKTFCRATIKSEAKVIQAQAEALFVDPNKEPKQIDLSSLPEVKRKRGLDPSIQPGYQRMVELSERTVTWKDGQGPFNHVHGGVMSIPLYRLLPENVKTMHINYRRKIPLGSLSQLDIHPSSQDKYQFVVKDKDTSNVQYDGFALLE